MSKEKEQSAFKILEPIASITLAVIGVLSTGASDFIRYGVILIAIVLAIAWLFSEAGWVGKAMKFRWFKTKLPNEQALRLSVMLDDVSNVMSDSYTLSPFYVWRNWSNKYPNIIRMNHSYFGSVHSWMSDVKEKFDDPGIDNLLLLGSLSKAVSETTRLAECVGRDLEELLRNEEVTKQDRLRILKEWDSSKNHFNQWIDKWRTLFKEINKTTEVQCVDYFRPLEMLD